jgi:hypothetical protein
LLFKNGKSRALLPGFFVLDPAWYGKNTGGEGGIVSPCLEKTWEKNLKP